MHPQLLLLADFTSSQQLTGRKVLRTWCNENITDPWLKTVITEVSGASRSVGSKKFLRDVKTAYLKAILRNHPKKDYILKVLAALPERLGITNSFQYATMFIKEKELRTLILKSTTRGRDNLYTLLIDFWLTEIYSGE